MRLVHHSEDMTATWCSSCMLVAGAGRDVLLSNPYIPHPSQPPEQYSIIKYLCQQS
jgi:hypothetical protein